MKHLMLYAFILCFSTYAADDYSGSIFVLNNADKKGDFTVTLGCFTSSHGYKNLKSAGEAVTLEGKESTECNNSDNESQTQDVVFWHNSESVGLTGSMLLPNCDKGQFRCIKISPTGNFYGDPTIGTVWSSHGTVDSKVEADTCYDTRAQAYVECLALHDIVEL